jgi:hypothetical protein
MDVFYRSLLVDRASVEEATYHARLALLRNRSRRAPFMLRVELADHIVPVLYGSNLTNNALTRTSPWQRLQDQLPPSCGLAQVNRHWGRFSRSCGLRSISSSSTAPRSLTPTTP